MIKSLHKLYKYQLDSKKQNLMIMSQKKAILVDKIYQIDNDLAAEYKLLLMSNDSSLYSGNYLTWTQQQYQIITKTIYEIDLDIKNIKQDMAAMLINIKRCEKIIDYKQQVFDYKLNKKEEDHINDMNIYNHYKVLAKNMDVQQHDLLG